MVERFSPEKRCCDIVGASSSSLSSPPRTTMAPGIALFDTNKTGKQYFPYFFKLWCYVRLLFICGTCKLVFVDMAIRKMSFHGFICVERCYSRGHGCSGEEKERGWGGANDVSNSAFLVKNTPQNYTIAIPALLWLSTHVVTVQRRLCGSAIMFVLLPRRYKGLWSSYQTLLPSGGSDMIFHFSSDRQLHASQKVNKSNNETPTEPLRQRTVFDPNTFLITIL